MSDGDSATPGEDRPSGRTPGHDGSGRARQRDPGRRSGNHTEGVSVAELIAKVTGSDQINPVTRRSADIVDDDSLATTPIPVPAGRRELPDLAAIARERSARSGAAGSGPRTGHDDRRRRRAVVVARSIAALIAVSALAMTGAAWQWQSAKNKLLNTIAALDPNSSDIRDPNAQNGDENFLIIGVDSRIGANSEMGAGDTSVAEGARSDTIMLVNIPANRERVVAVSFPRDLAISPMMCQAWDPATGRYGPVYDENTGEWSDNERYTETKLNSAYALGGPKCLVKVIQKMSGLAINRFMAVDFAGFSKMVDALGGVEVCSPTPLEDAELGVVLANAGRQKLDGHTALNYVRARSIASEDNGDYGRIKRQQLFLSSLLRSIISTDTLFDYNKLDDVVNMFIDDSYVDNVRTRDLVQLGQSLQGVNAGRITFVTVPTTGYTDAEGNEEPRTEDIRALFDAIIDDDPLPGENDKDETLNPLSGSATSPGSSSSTTTSSSTESTWETDPTQTTTEQVNAVAADPRDVTVQVTDATETGGLADTAATQFELYGFKVQAPDNYLDISAVYSTTVFYSLGNEQAAATVAATLPGARVERISGLGETVQVVLGSNFATVRYPPASGSQLSMNATYTGSTTPSRLPADLNVTNGADVTCD